MRYFVIILMCLLCFSLVHAEEFSYMADKNLTAGDIYKIDNSPDISLYDKNGAKIILKSPFIRTKIITTWSTVSMTTPVNKHPMIPAWPECNQIGNEWKVTYIVIQYKGKTHEVELERELIQSDKELKRSIKCDDMSA